MFSRWFFKRSPLLILQEWLAKNPKYQDIVEEKRDAILSENNNDVTSILTMYVLERRF